MHNFFLFSFIILFSLLDLGTANNLHERAPNSVFYFTDGYGIGWCSLTQPGVNSVADCTPENSNYTTLQLDNLAIVADYYGNSYGVTTYNTGWEPSYIQIWSFRLENGNVTLNDTAKVPFRIEQSGARRATAQYAQISSPISTDVIVVGAISVEQFQGVKNDVAVIAVGKWQVLFSFSTNQTYSAIFGGVALAANYVYAASGLNLNYPTSMLIAYNMDTMNYTTIYECTNDEIDTCRIQGLVVMYGALYFSSGMNVWRLSPYNNVVEWVYTFSSDVSGVYGAAWGDQSTDYWYIDDIRNTNYLSSGTNYPRSNELGNIATDTISSAIISS